jgi:hypothetical protein
MNFATPFVPQGAHAVAVAMAADRGLRFRPLRKKFAMRAKFFWRDVRTPGRAMRRFHNRIKYLGLFGPSKNYFPN